VQPPMVSDVAVLHKRELNEKLCKINGDVHFIIIFCL